jgi:hypothetical protein
MAVAGEALDTLTGTIKMNGATAATTLSRRTPRA